MATRDDIFDWAIRNNKRLPMTSGSYINMPAARAFYKEETAQEHIGDGNSSAALSERAKHEKRDDDGKFAAGGGKEDAPDVVELDENSELMKRVEGLSRKERVKAVENYLREVLGGREIEFHDGIKATVTGRDADKLARDTYHAEKGERRTAELSEVEKLIDAARFVKKSEVTEHNKDRFSEFRYYRVATRYKGEEEELLLNVGRNIHTNKYQFYAITSSK